MIARSFSYLFTTRKERQKRQETWVNGLQLEAAVNVPRVKHKLTIKLAKENSLLCWLNAARFFLRFKFSYSRVFLIDLDRVTVRYS